MCFHNRVDICYRFGTTVYCLDSVGRLLPKEDPEAVAVLQKQLEKDGELMYICNVMIIIGVIYV